MSNSSINMYVILFWFLVSIQVAMCPPVLDEDVFDRGAKVKSQFAVPSMGFCELYTIWFDTKGSTTEVDLPNCQKMADCLRLNELYLMSGANHIEMFECAANIWPQQFKPLDLQSEYLPYSRIKNFLTKEGRKAEDLQEPQFYSAILHPKLYGPYPDLITQMDNMYYQGHKARDSSIKETKAHPDALSRIPTSIGDVCYTHYMLPDLLKEDQFEPMLDRTWYCRKFMNCLEKYLVTQATQTYSHQQPWHFYECARQSQQEAFPFWTAPFLKKKRPYVPPPKPWYCRISNSFSGCKD